MRKALFFTLILLMLLGAAYGADCRGREFTTLDGKQVKLSDFEGRRLLLVFWTTWCPWCRKQMEQLKGLYENYRGEVAVLAVSVDREREKLESFVQEKGLPFPVIHDESRSLSACYGGIRAYPTLLILDENLRVQRRFTGFVHRDILEAELFSSF